MDPRKAEGRESTGSDPNRYSFESLVAAARRGDQEAASKLIERYRNYLLLIANEDLGTELRAKIGASDIVQETLMQAQVNFRQFNGTSEAEWKAWLRTIILNDLRKCRRAFDTKKRNASREIHADDQSAVYRGLHDQHPSPSSDAMRRENAQVMTQALGQLSNDQQTVIQLRNFEQLSFEEIGRQMDRSPDAARKLWARAIEALKNALKNISPKWLESQSSAKPRHE
jgi:RNA polymerase sigma-70 factor (ECF subfamily)